MRSFFTILVAFLASTLGACAPMVDRVVPEPSQISLQDAMLSVADSFYEMRKKTAENRLDLLACEVDVTFKIGANASDKNKLGIDLTRTIAVPPITSVISPSYGYEGSIDGSRGNEITIKMVHIGCLKNDTFLATKSKDMPDAKKKVGDTLFSIY